MRITPPQGAQTVF